MAMLGEVFTRQVAVEERRKSRGLTGLTEAVAQNLFKLMAYKDEYEVARLYSDGTFHANLAKQFEGDLKLTFHLAPPLISRRDSETGILIKREFGSWMVAAFKVLAKMKGLRGTRWDIFGYTAERRAERAAIPSYRLIVEELMDGLGPANHAMAIEIASLPLKIRGYGHIKEKNQRLVAAEQEQLMASWRNPQYQPTAAE